MSRAETENSADAFIIAEDVGAAMTTLRGKETQTVCARRAGLDRASWNQYENGKIFPKPESLERIAQGLAVDVADLTEAVIQAWSRRMDRDPLVLHPKTQRYNFTVTGQVEFTEAPSHQET